MPEGNSNAGGAANLQNEALPKTVYKDFLMEIATANVWVASMSGPVATGYVLLLGASEFEFGLMASIGSLAGISAPVFSYFVDRFAKKKKLTLFACLPVRLIQFLMAAIPLLIFYKIMPNPLLFYLALVVIMSFFNVFSGQAWFSWMGEIIPAKQRGYYFGRRSFVGGAVGMIFAVIAGMFMDGFSNKHFAFSSLFLFGSIFSMIAYYYFTRLPEAK
ncbi:MAG: MFS transporter, partial [Candidatus Firestonebacteria bacterium]